MESAIEINGEDLFEITSALREYYKDYFAVAKDYFAAAPQSSDPALNPEKLASLVMNSKDPKSLPGKILEVYTKYNRDNTIDEKLGCSVLSHVNNTVVVTVKFSEEHLKILSIAIQTYLKTLKSGSWECDILEDLLNKILFRDDSLCVVIDNKNGNSITCYISNLFFESDNGDLYVRHRNCRDFRIVNEIQVSEIKDIYINGYKYEMSFLLGLKEIRDRPDDHLENKEYKVHITYHNLDLVSEFRGDLADFSLPYKNEFSFVNNDGDHVIFSETKIQNLWINEKQSTVKNFIDCKLSQMALMEGLQKN